MSKTLTLAGLVTAALLSSTATASIGGKPVVLVHGFAPDQLFDNPDSFDEVKRDGDAYWADYWLSRAEATVHWDSSERIEGGIAEDAYRQVVEISRSGLCNDGCVFLSHSTGGLLTRFLLENQNRWLAQDGLNPINVLATIDLASADGGTEIADLGISLAYNDNFFLSGAKAAFGAVFGVQPTPDNLGVVNDLQTNEARSLAVTPNGIPRLRVVGGGSPYLGVTKGFIDGKDDGVVPVHSACGGTSAEPVDSCVSWQAMTGKLTNQKAPGALWYNHYPILMAEKSDHNGMRGTQGGVTATPVVNNVWVNGLVVDFAENRYEKRPWWKLWGSGDQYVVVPGSESKNLSAVVYDTLQ
jgi:hypothetical protein